MNDNITISTFQLFKMFPEGAVGRRRENENALCAEAGSRRVKRRNCRYMP